MIQLLIFSPAFSDTHHPKKMPVHPPGDAWPGAGTDPHARVHDAKGGKTPAPIPASWQARNPADHTASPPLAGRPRPRAWTTARTTARTTADHGRRRTTARRQTAHHRQRRHPTVTCTRADPGIREDLTHEPRPVAATTPSTSLGPAAPPRTRVRRRPVAVTRSGCASHPIPGMRPYSESNGHQGPTAITVRTAIKNRTSSRPERPERPERTERPKRTGRHQGPNASALIAERNRNHSSGSNSKIGPYGSLPSRIRTVNSEVDTSTQLPSPQRELFRHPACVDGLSPNVPPLLAAGRSCARAGQRSVFPRRSAARRSR
ncbi:hypothetical protein EDD30_0060 [Couchioplanes caeruleus]|uniref:Uncharacterized protein n=1 Tax=Couchioplanes caeruleus TaxID=56438 RepID=A0A3N1GAZ0_9ACTN|nr:hypothetical protein EDD30_0060 [Couchioplanes caeruleus]